MTAAEFRTIRKRAGWTQVTLALALRVSLRQVKYYEAGAHPIPGPISALMERIDHDARVYTS